MKPGHPSLGHRRKPNPWDLSGCCPPFKFSLSSHSTLSSVFVLCCGTSTRKKCRTWTTSRNEIEHMRAQVGRQRKRSSHSKGSGSPRPPRNFSWPECRPKIEGFASSATSSSSPPPIRAECWEAANGKTLSIRRARPCPFLHALGKRPPSGDEGRLVLRPRPGNHRGDRPIRGSRYGET
jgi:hypothetical protein